MAKGKGRVSRFSGKPVSSLKSSKPKADKPVQKTMNPKKPAGADARTAQAIRQNKKTKKGRTN